MVDFHLAKSVFDLEFYLLPTFMTSSLFSSHLTKTEEEDERGRDVARDDTS